MYAVATFSENKIKLFSIWSTQILLIRSTIEIPSSPYTKAKVSN